YHAYPYYPDFIGLDSTYGAARSSAGASHYYGYLLDLKRHHAGRALLIAEYGVPSSRGLAHLQPEGLHHGGHDEREMAQQDVRLRVGSDAAFLYLALESALGIDSTRWAVGIDTYRPDRGQFALPGLPDSTPTGVEFALVLNDTADAQLLVTPGYNPYLGPRPG